MEAKHTRGDDVEKRELDALRWVDDQAGHASEASFTERFDNFTFNTLLGEFMKLKDGLLELTYYGERAIGV